MKMKILSVSKTSQFLPKSKDLLTPFLHPMGLFGSSITELHGETTRTPNFSTSAIGMGISPQSHNLQSTKRMAPSR
jgi:hypothetical protein